MPPNPWREALRRTSGGIDIGAVWRPGTWFRGGWVKVTRSAGDTGLPYNDFDRFASAIGPRFERPTAQFVFNSI